MPDEAIVGGGNWKADFALKSRYEVSYDKAGSVKKVALAVCKYSLIGTIISALCGMYRTRLYQVTSGGSYFEIADKSKFDKLKPASKGQISSTGMSQEAVKSFAISILQKSGYASELLGFDDQDFSRLSAMAIACVAGNHDEVGKYVAEKREFIGKDLLDRRTRDALQTQNDRKKTIEDKCGKVASVVSYDEWERPPFSKISAVSTQINSKGIDLETVKAEESLQHTASHIEKSVETGALIRALLGDLIYSPGPEYLPFQPSDPLRMRNLLATHGEALRAIALDSTLLKQSFGFLSVFASDVIGSVQALAEKACGYKEPVQKSGFLALFSSWRSFSPKDSQSAMNSGDPPVEVGHTGGTNLLKGLSSAELKTVIEGNLQTITDTELMAAPDFLYKRMQTTAKTVPALLSASSAPSNNLEESLDFRASLQSFLNKVLVDYVDKADDMHRRAMFATLLREGGLDPANTALAFLKGAGPLVQKMFQLFGDELKDPKLRAAVGEIKSGLSPIDHDLCTVMLNQIVEHSHGKIKHIQVIKACGAASVGVALKAKLFFSDGEPKNVVIKLLRPGIRRRADDEGKIFQAAADATGGGMRQIFDSTIKQIAGEFDLSAEAENIEKAKVYDRRSKTPNVSAVKLVPGIKPNPSYLVLEEAPGLTVDRYLKKIQLTSATGDTAEKTLDELDALGRTMESVAERWYEEAAFGSGFYHGDLHGGNMVYDPDKKAVTTIDFGNAGQLTSNERSLILRMLVASEAQNSALFLQDFKKVLTPEGREQFDKRSKAFSVKVDNILKSTHGPGAKIESIMNEAKELGIEVPPVVINFSRSEMLLEKIFDDISTRMKPLMGPSEESKNIVGEMERLETDYRKSLNRISDILQRLPESLVNQYGSLAEMKIVIGSGADIFTKVTNLYEMPTLDNSQKLEMVGFANALNAENIQCEGKDLTVEVAAILVLSLLNNLKLDAKEYFDTAEKLRLDAHARNMDETIYRKWVKADAPNSEKSHTPPSIKNALDRVNGRNMVNIARLLGVGFMRKIDQTGA